MSHLDEENVGACFGEAYRNSLTDAASAAGDERDMPLERKHVGY